MKYKTNYYINDKLQNDFNLLVKFDLRNEKSNAGKIALFIRRYRNINDRKHIARQFIVFGLVAPVLLTLPAGNSQNRWHMPAR